MSYNPEKSLFPEDRFINKELSWLAFNERVLEEASNTYHPLMERLKFLSISANNLDEFYMTRVAGLKSQAKHGLKKQESENLLINEQLKQIHIRAQSLIETQQQRWQKFTQELRTHKIDVLTRTKYLASDLKWLEQYFLSNIAPELTISYPEKNNFPLIPNLNIASCVFFDKSSKNPAAIIDISSKLERFIQLPALRKIEPNAQRARFALLEDVINLFQKLLFPEEKIKDYGLFHVIRDSELDVSDEADDLINSFKVALKKRKKGNVIRLAISAKAPKAIKDYLTTEINLDSTAIVQGSEFLSLASTMELYNRTNLNLAALKYEPQNIRFPERINDYGGDCFAAIDAKDIIVHHPYESFDVVVKFLQQATKDPYVTHIKQTLYRIGPENSIVHTLIEAAKAGKDVTVIVELKARFDEASNLNWGKELQEAGAKVIYGIPGLKIHAKMSLIQRKKDNNNPDKIQSYVHLGTGNYHPQNARVYSDLSFFTCDGKLREDVINLFRFLEGYAAPKSYNKLSVAPFTLRKNLITLIDKEIEFANNNKTANIWLKMNSLADKELIDKLYEASQAGVKIEIIVRGVCCIKPGVENLSENITVKSIIGRFLEHSRIFCFGNGHTLPSSKSKVFIAPADWIKQKLDNRVEVMIPIENKTVHEQVLGQILHSNIKDVKQSWKMDNEGNFKRLPFNKASFSTHEFFISNPSLSGRGSALKSKKHLPSMHQTYTSSYIAGNEVAVIDIGSNSIRLVIYDGIKRTPLALLNEKSPCRLAEDMEKTGRLNINGVKLAYQSIERFVTIIRSMNIKNLICFATSAVRDSEDGEIFIRNIEKNCKINIKILSGKEEAHLSCLGIASAFYIADGVVGDLGGGSLELAKISFNPNDEKQMKNEDIVSQCISFPIGPLRLQANNKLSTTQIIDDSLERFPLKSTLKGKVFYAVGGGFRSLAKLHLTRAKYPIKVLEQYSVTPQDFLKTVDLVAKSSAKQIAKMPSVSSNRAGILASTALIMQRIIKFGQPAKIIFSTHGVREGVLFDTLEAFSQGDDALIAGCSDMINHISPNSFDGSSQKDKQWVEYGVDLYSWITPVIKHLNKKNDFKNFERLCKAGCILSRLAWHEHSAYRAEMAFRWVLDSKIPAMNHQERIFIANILFYRYQTNSNYPFITRTQNLLGPKQLNNAKTIGQAIRLAYQLSGGAKNIFAITRLKIKTRKITITCSKTNQVLINQEVRKRLDKLARALHLTSDIT